MTDENNDNIELATALAVAWLSNPNTRASADDIPGFLSSVHGALGKLTAPTADAVEDAAAIHTPAISARKSLADPDYIVSMIDGKKYKTLKRHLGINGLTPDQYRERYGLKANYPMTAPAYSAVRSATAKALGLGRKAVQTASDAIGDEKFAPKAPKARKGKTVAEAKAAARAHLGGKE